MRKFFAQMHPMDENGEDHEAMKQIIATGDVSLILGGSLLNNMDKLLSLDEDDMRRVLEVLRCPPPEGTPLEDLMYMEMQKCALEMADSLERMYLEVHRIRRDHLESN